MAEKERTPDSRCTSRLGFSFSGNDSAPVASQTQGTANAAPDAPLVPPSQIIGRVVGYAPAPTGLLVTLLGAPSVLLLILTLGAILIYAPPRGKLT
jgi:hypothetical protein